MAFPLKNILSRLFSVVYLAASAVIVLIFLESGCGNKCQDIECKNGGACVDGTCNCADGYSGSDCSTNISANFLGTYNVSEVCPDITTYTVNVFADTLSIFTVHISGFYHGGFSNPVTATVTNNSIQIAAQDPDNDGRIVSGEGTLVPPYEIDWNYSVSDAVGTVSCSNSKWVK